MYNIVIRKCLKLTYMQSSPAKKYFMLFQDGLLKEINLKKLQCTKWLNKFPVLSSGWHYFPFHHLCFIRRMCLSTFAARRIPKSTAHPERG